MVDAIVSFAVERLGRFGEFLIQEVTSLRGVKDEVDTLKKELQWMQCFLKDAEEKQYGDSRSIMRQWITDVRDICYDAEDVIDTFILKVQMERGTQETTPKKGLSHVLKKFSPISFNKEIHKQIDLYNIGEDIKALNKRIHDIARRREDYGIKNLDDVGKETRDAIETLRQIRRTSPYEDEEHVVGLEDVAASLVDELLKAEPRRCVISIWGMGGLGKTTIAKKLYHHTKVKGKFEHRAWICVSQEYKIRDLLQRIIKSFKRPFSKEDLEKLEKMTEEDLERDLHEFLKGLQYLIVIDDVWDKEAWKILRSAFPDNKNGSRVIVTTRKEDIAERFDERTHVHKLRFLSLEESWELFCKKAFPNHSADGETNQCPPSLKTVGKEMVEKCCGLPLAIIVLGGLLSRKMPYEWHKVKEHIWRDLRNDSIEVPLLLALSFNDLPYQLKACFLYLALFPEDFEINTRKQIRLWVAEGFTPPGEKTLEEVAEDWLNELIGRSLVQVAKRNWRRITACRVHDLLRDLAVQKAKELNFLHIYDGNINSTPSSSSDAPSYRRHAAYFMSLERYVSFDYSSPYLRTLLFPNQDHDEIPNPGLDEFPNLGPDEFPSLGFLECLHQERTAQSTINLCKFIHERFKLLRVLDLHFSYRSYEIHRRERDGYRSFSLPDAMGEMIHLRYLGLKDSEIDELPPSLANLKALQTLHVVSGSKWYKCWPVIFEGNISELQQLRHLIGQFERLSRVDHLTNLQTLKLVDINDWIKINTVKLTSLRELCINCRMQSGPTGFTWDSIANLRNLQTLSIDLPINMYFPPIQPLYKCRHLLKLVIRGGIESLPEQMHQCLPNLEFLTLKEFRLSQDPMPTLEKLQNLKVLRLSNDLSEQVKTLNCTAGGFPRLQFLHLYRLKGLIEFRRGGAMPMIKSLTAAKCSARVPEIRGSDLNWDSDSD